MFCFEALRGQRSPALPVCTPLSLIGEMIALHASVCFGAFLCACVRDCTRGVPPTHQIVEEKDNSLTRPSWLPLSYAPACVRVSPTASRTTSPRRDKYHTALTYEAAI